MADIDLDITIDDDALFRSLNRAENELKDISQQAEKTSKDISSSFKKAEGSVDSFNKELTDTQRKFDQTTQKAAQSNRGLGSQLKSFRRETGLIFAGTIGAIAGVATAAQQAAEKFVPLIAVQKRTTEAAEEAFASYIKERQGLNALVAAATDTNRSKKEQQAATDIIIEQYKTLLPNISEEIRLKGVQATVEEKLIGLIIKQTAEKAKAAVRDKLLQDLALSELEGLQKRIAAFSGGAGNAVTGGFQLIQAFLADTESEAIKTQLALLNTVEGTITKVLSDLDKAGVQFGQDTETANAQINEFLTNTSSGSKKAVEDVKVLTGSIADLEAQLAKINTQIREQTALSDVETLQNLTTQAEDLEAKIKAANDQLEALRTQPPAEIELPAIPNIESIDVVTFEERQQQFEQERELLAAQLEERQQAQILLLKQAKSTEEQITAEQEKQEKERQKLALETEQKRLEFLLRFGQEQTEAQTQILEAQLNAIKSQLQGFDIQAEQAVGGKKSFFEILGLDPNTEEGAAAIEAMKQGVQIALDNLQQLFDKQVELAEAEVQRREENVQNLRQQLDQELQLNEQGFASNVELVRRQIQEEEQERQKALERQKKARQAQLALETITQAANLITASSQIFNTFAALPFGIGIPIAAGVIAAMIGSFIAFKVQAFKAASQNFAEGGRLPTLQAGGRSDRHGGRGHRVEDSNIVLGGGEHVTNAHDSEIHNDFLSNLNKGKYRKLDLVSIVEGRKGRIRSMQNNVAIIERQQQNDLKQALKEALRDELQPHVSKYLKKLITKKSIFPTSTGYMESETDLQGNTKITNVKTR